MSKQQPKRASNTQVIMFMVTLSFVCALILSVLASVLKKSQEIAKELDQSKQMLIAARIFTHQGYFLMRNEEGKYIPAKYSKNGVLIPGSAQDIPTRSEILEIYKRRIRPMLANNKGDIASFKKAGININQYIPQYQKAGYSNLPWKLIYEIFPNPKPGKAPEKEEKPDGYVIPVNGFGLWDAIYGYLAIEPNGDTVIGISWYEQKETPGLGANIADEPWQSQFPGKDIFQPGPSGTTDFKTAPLGIKVVKGKVAEVFGDTPKAKSAVDGMPGATLTGNGVTNAYKDVLAEYRPFFIKVHKESETKQKES